MKPLIKLKTTTLLVIPLVLACFALLPSAQGETQAETISPAVFAELPGFNTAAGFNVLDSLTTGIFNSGFGALALEDNTTGHDNTALGAQALRNNTTGFQNTAVGENALVFNIDGNQNMALGQGALAKNVTGDNNTAMGFQALNVNTTNNNTAVGFQALRFNTTGGNNTAVGLQALFSNTLGNFNTANGTGALFSNTEGIGNTAIGGEALGLNTTGDSNVAIGGGAGGAVTTADHVICIGANGENTSDRTYIGNIGTFTQNFSAGVNGFVTVNLATGRLGSFNPMISSRRYKEDIKPLDKTSEALFSLKPVSYRLKEEFDPTQALAFGLIAEEVEKVNPDLVSRNNKGQVESVRYEMVNAMVLNEFLKEHSTVQELKATVAEQQKQIEALTATVQKVSAQLELNKPAPRTVNNQ